MTSSPSEGPATPQTKELMNTKQFALMKSDAIFCNIARGVCVHQEAMVHALETGEIAFAGAHFDLLPTWI